MGIPLKVQGALEGDLVLCVDDRDRPYTLPVQTALLDAAPCTGDWLLVHVDTAIRALDEDEALQIGRALQAVQLAERGEDFEHLIADLVNREPQLPAHLRGDRGDDLPPSPARHPLSHEGETSDV